MACSPSSSEDVMTILKYRKQTAMRAEPPMPTHPMQRRKKALTVGVGASLAYLLFSLIIKLFPQLPVPLTLMWLLPTGPGYVFVLLLHPIKLTALHQVILYSSGAFFTFVVAATSVCAVRFRWAIIILWLIIAFGAAALSLLLTLIAIAEPIP